MKMELRRLRFDEQVRSEKRKSRRLADRERGDRHAQALARGGHAAHRRGERALPAGRVRRRPLAGAPRRRARTSTGTRRVLPPHLPHREPEAPARRAACSASPARAATRWCSSRPTSAAARRTRCWRSTTCSPGANAERAGGRRRGAGGGGRRRALPKAKRVVLVGNKISPGNPSHQAGRHGGAHAVGRAGLAARRQEGLRARQGRRREGDEPRRRAARAVQRVRAVPDPDRRVGGLRAPAPRPERPAGRRLRDAVHVRPGAHRVGQAREATACS